jgi:hypothetical protein
VAKFCGCVASEKALNRSGTNEDDMIDQAKALFSSTGKKRFILAYCWRILKDSEKFKLQSQPHSTPKSRPVEEIAFPTPTIDDKEDEGDSECDNGQRPPGNKKSKRMPKESVQISNHNTKLADAANALAAASQKKAEAFERATALQLFTISLDGLDEASKRYIMWQRRKIIEKSGMGEIENDQAEL